MPPTRRGKASGRGGKKRGRRKKVSVSEDSLSDHEFDDDPMISGKWSYSVTSKVVDPNFEIPCLIDHLKGKELDIDYVRKSGLQKPVLIENTDGLYMKAPRPESRFGVDDVKRHVGGNRLIEVVEVATQKSRKMTVKDFVKYYKTPFEKRKELLNVLSLEFSLTKLENYVKAPAIVKQIDWVERLWPEALKSAGEGDKAEKQTKVNYPKVQNYCLMSVQGCYTDFHVDFGGTSVWYHVLRGEKVFWMIPPTETNFKLYEAWTLSGMAQDDVFFGEVVEKCHRVMLKPGQTFFIPSGWIHAVYTPVDALVFGGNFLHNYAIPTQLRVYDLECSTHVSQKFRYPYFVPILWYVAADFIQKLCGRRYYSAEDVISQFFEGESSEAEISGYPGDREKSPSDENDEGVKKEDETDGVKEEGTEEASEKHAFCRPPVPTEWNIDAMKGLSRPFEVEGLKELAKWLSKLPPKKHQVPYGISHHEWLLRDLKMAAYNIDLCLTEGSVEAENEKRNMDIQESQSQDKETPNTSADFDSMDATIDSVISNTTTVTSEDLLKAELPNDSNTTNVTSEDSVKTELPNDSPPDVKKAKMDSNEGKTETSSTENVWGFDPLTSVVPLGHKPLPSALRKIPGNAGSKRPNILSPRLKQTPPGSGKLQSTPNSARQSQERGQANAQGFDFANLAFSAMNQPKSAPQSATLKSILKAKENPTGQYGSVNNQGPDILPSYSVHGHTPTELRQFPVAGTLNSPPTYSNVHTSSYVSPHVQASAHVPYQVINRESTYQGNLPGSPWIPRGRLTYQEPSKMNVPLVLTPLDISISSGRKTTAKEPPSALSPDEARVLEELTKIQSGFTDEKLPDKNELSDEHRAESTNSDGDDAMSEEMNSLFTLEQVNAIKELEHLTAVLTEKR